MGTALVPAPFLPGPLAGHPTSLTGPPPAASHHPGESQPQAFSSPTSISSLRAPTKPCARGQSDTGRKSSLEGGDGIGAAERLAVPLPVPSGFRCPWGRLKWALQQHRPGGARPGRGGRQLPCPGAAWPATGLAKADANCENTSRERSQLGCRQLPAQSAKQLTGSEAEPVLPPA